jgi:hypothetical protein
LREGEDEGIRGEVGGGTEAGEEGVEGGGVDAAAAADGLADAGVAVPEQPDGSIDVVEDGGKKKRKKTVLRLKVRLPAKSKATDATGGEGIKEDEDLKAFVDAQSSPEPAKKRQKTLDTTTEVNNAASLETNAAAAQPSPEPPAEKLQKSLDTTGGDEAAASSKANAAAARAVVFGLRARK